MSKGSEELEHKLSQINKNLIQSENTIYDKTTIGLVLKSLNLDNEIDSYKSFLIKTTKLELKFIKRLRIVILFYQ